MLSLRNICLIDEWSQMFREPSGTLDQMLKSQTFCWNVEQQIVDFTTNEVSHWQTLALNLRALGFRFGATYYRHRLYLKRALIKPVTFPL